MSRLWRTHGQWKVEQYSVWAESAISHTFPRRGAHGHREWNVLWGKVVIRRGYVAGQEVRGGVVVAIVLVNYSCGEEGKVRPSTQFPDQWPFPGSKQRDAQSRIVRQIPMNKRLCDTSTCTGAHKHTLNRKYICAQCANNITWFTYCASNKPLLGCRPWSLVSTDLRPFQSQDPAQCALNTRIVGKDWCMSGLDHCSFWFLHCQKVLKSKYSAIHSVKVLFLWCVQCISHLIFHI